MADRALILTDWIARDGRHVGVTFREGSLASSYVASDSRFDDLNHASRVRAWIDRAYAAGERVIDLRTAAAETVQLHDGPELQNLVPGVAPVPLTARQLAQERQRRETRRGHAPLPCGGLWDETAMNQGSLF